MRMKIAKGVGLATLLALALGTGSALAETKLVLSSWAPSKHPLVAHAIKPWAKQVKKVTEGRVSIRVLAKPLGPPPAHYDMAVDNVADITYGLHSFTKDDRFLRSRIGQFSYLGDSAQSVSKAYWQVYSGELEAQKEHKGVKLLSLFTHGPGLLLTSKNQVTDKTHLAGLKVRTPGGYIADLAKGLGVTTQFMSSVEVYEKLSRGVIDGVTMPANSFYSHRLAQHAKYAMRMPGGFYNTSWFLVMNQAKWDSISKKDQEAIMYISGEAFAELAGKVWDKADQKGLDFARQENVSFYDISDELLGEVQTLSSRLEEQWIKAIAKDGYDGRAALGALRGQ